MRLYTPPEALPFEIWSKIFELSCTDDGYTGHSLSQVSRFFHLMSAPYKFQSVSLRNIKFVLRFYEVLKEKPPHLRRVRYLCIADDGDLLAAMYGVHSNWDRDVCFSFAQQDRDTSGSHDPEQNSDVEGGAQEASESGSDSSSNTQEDVEDLSLSEVETTELEEELAFIQSPEGAEYFPEGCSIEGCLLPQTDEGNRFFDKLFLDTIHSIFELCSHSLWILSVLVDTIISAGHEIPLLPEVYMPHLRELTWGVPMGLGSWTGTPQTPTTSLPSSCTPSFSLTGTPISS